MCTRLYSFCLCYHHVSVFIAFQSSSCLCPYPVSSSFALPYVYLHPISVLALRMSSPSVLIFCVSSSCLHFMHVFILSLSSYHPVYIFILSVSQPCLSPRPVYVFILSLFSPCVCLHPISVFTLPLSSPCSSCFCPLPVHEDPVSVPTRCTSSSCLFLHLISVFILFCFHPVSVLVLKPFLIHMSITCICALSRVRLAGRSQAVRTSCVAKPLTLDITHKLLNQFSFIPAMLIDTIVFYHLIPLSLILTLPGGHKVSAKQNLLASFSPTFSPDQDEI